MASRLSRSSGMLSCGRGASSSVSSSPSSPPPVGGGQRVLRQPTREVEQPGKIVQDPALLCLTVRPSPQRKRLRCPKGLF